MHSPEALAFTIRRPWPKRPDSRGYRWWPHLIDVWHIEPGGADALTVCGKTRWRLHVHHWRVQIRPLQTLKRFLFERCEECGRRYPWGYAPTSHQWDEDPAPWFRVTRRAFHRECSSLVHFQTVAASDEHLLNVLVTELAVYSRQPRAVVIDRLTGSRSRLLSFLQGRRLEQVAGFERDDDYRLRRKVEES